MNFSKRFGNLLICLFIIISLTGSIILFSSEADSQSYNYSLYDAAINHDFVTVSIQGAYSGESILANLETGDGVFFGECIEIQVESNVDETLSITLNLGRQLICREYNIQNMVVTEAFSFNLEPYQTTTFTVNAMCMNMYEDAPVWGVYYDFFESISSGDTYFVVNEISQGYSQNAAGQCALWAVTDNADADYLIEYGATNDELTSAQGILDSVGVSHNLGVGSTQGGGSIDFLLIGVIIIIVVIVVIVVLFFIMRKNKRTLPPKPVQPLPPQPQTPPPAQTPVNQNIPKFCTNCGTELINNAKFCAKCGKKL